MMCLAVPGKVLSVDDGQADVDFQGTRRQVSLLLTPEVRRDDWVLVHAGFAIARIEESEAQRTWDYLREVEMIEEVVE